MAIGRRSRGELLELVDGIGALEPPATTDDAVQELRTDATAQTFEVFYRLELPGLVTLSRALAGRALAEDVAQEAMLAAYRRWDEVQRQDSPVGWVREVCMRKAMSLLRRRNAEQGVLRQLGSFRAEAPPSPAEEERFWSAVRALPRRQAQAVALHYALDLPVAEVASSLGRPEETVRAQLARARATLAVTLDLPQEEP